MSGQRAKKLADENKKLEDDVAALQDVLAIASSGNSKTAGYKVSGTQAAGRSSVLVSQFWEHGKKGKLHGYKEESDLQDEDLRKGTADDSPSSAGSQGARPKSAIKSSRPSTASKSRASSANSTSRKSVVKEQEEASQIKHSREDLSEGLTDLRIEVAASSTKKEDHPTKASAKKVKQSPTTVSLKSKSPSAADTDVDLSIKTSKKVLPATTKSKGLTRDTVGQATESDSAIKSGQAGKTQQGSSAETKTKDGCQNAIKPENGSLKAKGKSFQAKDDDSTKQLGSKQKGNASSSTTTQVKGQLGDVGQKRTVNSAQSKNSVKNPDDSKGLRQASGSGNKEAASKTKPVCSTVRKGSAKSESQSGPAQSESKGSVKAGAETKPPTCKSSTIDDLAKTGSSISKSAKESTSVSTPDGNSGKGRPSSAVDKGSVNSKGRPSSAVDKGSVNSGSKVSEGVPPKSATSKVGTKVNSATTRATVANKNFDTKATNPEAAAATSNLKSASKESRKVTEKVEAQSSSSRKGPIKDRNKTEPKQTIAVVKEKDEETRQAEKEAARLAAQERQRRIHLARSPTTLISLDKDERSSDTNASRSSSRASSAKKNRKPGKQAVTEPNNEDIEELFDPYFDAKSFEERTAEMKAQVLQKLQRQVSKDNKVGDYIAPNKADKDNFNKSMTSGVARISPEGQGCDFAMDERGPFPSTYGRMVSCDPSVVAWLKELNLKNTDKYIRLFAEHEIDMDGLMFISEEQLKEIGIRAIGAYNKILMSIKELQKHRDQPHKTHQPFHSQDHHHQGKQPQYIDDDNDDDDDDEVEEEEDVSAEAIPIQATRSSMLRQTVTEAKRKPPEIPQPWLNPNRNKAVKSKINTGLPSKPERQIWRDRGDSAPSTFGQLRGGYREASKGHVVKASSLSRLHEEHQRQQQSWRMEQASSLNRLTNVGADTRDSYQYNPKQVDASVSFLPRPVYQKQKSLDWVPRHSDSSSSGDEFTHSGRRQRQLLAEREQLADSEPSMGMKIEIRKKSEFVVEEPHVPGQVAFNVTGRHREVAEDFERPKKPAKNIPRQSVALPVVQFGVGIAPSNISKGEDSTDGMQERRGQRPSQTDQASSRVDQTDSDNWSRRSEWSEDSGKKDKDRPTSRPRTQTLLNSIQDQLETLQSSSIKDNRGTKTLIERLQTQLVDIQKQVLQTHHQQQQLKASPRNAPPRIPDPLSPQGNNLKQENIRPRRQNHGVTSQRLQVTDNVTARSDSSSDAGSASTGTSPRSNSDKKLSPILRPEHSDLESGSSGRSRPNTSIHQGAPAKSQQEMLREIRKQKDGYRRKIKHLEAELARLKFKDPVRQMEVIQDEILFDEKGLIGEGAFSQVFRGNFHGSEVAVKRLRMKLSAQEKNYFAAEVSLMQDLRHPRVVLLLGVCTTAPLPLMILEFMPKGSLYYYLHDPDTAPLDHVAYYVIARDIALGMNYLHQHHPSVLHLDLKSMNVLLTQHLRAKIADFGFSKLRHDANLVGPSSGKHSVRGTPAWMAPELLDGGDMTVKVDVFSFGVILWEMLTRQHPYKGCSLFQVIERIRTKKRPEIPSQCPKSLSTLIAKCWEQLPSKRPTFKEIIPILEQMHFPPQWRMLFSAAGVPASALEDIESTRTLIDIITNSIDHVPTHPSEVDSGRGVSLSPNSGHHSIPDGHVDESMRIEAHSHYQLPDLALTGRRPVQTVTSDEYLTSSIEAVRTANEITISRPQQGQYHGQQPLSAKTKTPRKPSVPKKTPRNVPPAPPPPPPPPPPPMNPIPSTNTPMPATQDAHHNLMSGIKNAHLRSIPEQPEDRKTGNQPHNQTHATFALAAGDLTNQRDKLKPVTQSSSERSTRESSFLITSGDLAQQKERLRQVKATDVSKLRNLNEVSPNKLNSMAEILRKAMESRRIVIQGGEPSVDQSLNTVDWSMADL